MDRRRRAMAAGVFDGGVPSDPVISGLVYKYDFSNLATLWKDTARSVPVSAESDEIKGISDLSGNNNHMISTDAVDHAILDLLAQNGLSGALFGGNAVQMQTDNVVAHGIGTGDFYLIALTRYTGVGNSRSIWSNGAFAPVIYQMANGTIVVYWNAYKTFAGTYTTDHANHLIELYRESGTMKLVVDGVLDANTFDMSATSMANAKTEIGNDTSAESYDGHIFEVRFYAGLPLAGERIALRNFLNYKWSP